MVSDGWDGFGMPESSRRAHQLTWRAWRHLRRHQGRNDLGKDGRTVGRRAWDHVEHHLAETVYYVYIHICICDVYICICMYT